MSDGSPTLGPRVAHPNSGAPRNAPEFDRDSGGNGLRGIVVIPWRLTKLDTTRRIVGLGTANLELPVDAEFKELV